jgi:hypothetical protein
MNICNSLSNRPQSNSWAVSSIFRNLIKINLNNSFGSICHFFLFRPFVDFKFVSLITWNSLGPDIGSHLVICDVAARLTGYWINALRWHWQRQILLYPLAKLAIGLITARKCWMSGLRRWSLGRADCTERFAYDDVGGSDDWLFIFWLVRKCHRRKAKRGRNLQRWGRPRRPVKRTAKVSFKGSPRFAPPPAREPPRRQRRQRRLRPELSPLLARQPTAPLPANRQPPIRPTWRPPPGEVTTRPLAPQPYVMNL